MASETDVVVVVVAAVGVVVDVVVFIDKKGKKTKHAVNTAYFHVPQRQTYTASYIYVRVLCPSVARVWYIYNITTW